jgi:isoleucyl-tRNA synthetase
VEDLSNWYVRRSRRRFWKSESDADKLAAYQTLYQTLVTVARLLAPFTPFLAEGIHRNLCRGDSVHLADFPTASPGERDVALEAEMARAREAVVSGLAARDRSRLKVRQPLRSVTLTHEFQPEVAAIIREELNVKEVRTGGEFSLDTEVTEELRTEGRARDAVRCIQDLRKRSGLNIEDRVVLFYEAGDDWRQVFERFGEYIAAETLAREVLAERPDGMEGAACEEGLWIGLRRVS